MATPIDLGLPSGTKWADCNVGATRPEEYGMYFAWGATEGAGSDISDGKVFDWSTSPYPQKGDIPRVLDTEHDAARVNMGAPWEMPKKSDFDELLTNTTTVWTKMNGIYGRLVTSKINGATLFFPASGYRSGPSIYSIGFDGYYWSTTRYLSLLPPQFAFDLASSLDIFRVYDINSRHLGFSVRAIQRKE